MVCCTAWSLSCLLGEEGSPMTLYSLGAGMPIPPRGCLGGLGGQRGEGLGSSKAPLPYSCSRQRTTCSPALPPTPGLPAVALVTGAALWLLELPPPTMARQSCPKHIIGSRLQRKSWNQAEPLFSAKTLPFVPGPDKPDRPDNGGSSLP